MRRSLPAAETDSADDQRDHEVSADAPEIAAIRARLEGVSRESYLLLFSLMKSISVAAFVYALVQFSGAETDAWVTRSAFWAASLVGLILTYHAAVFGSVIHPLRFSVVDSALPLLLAVVEALLFLVLAIEPSRAPVPGAWYFVFAAWAAIAAAIVWRVRREVAAEAMSGSVTRQALEHQVQYLKTDGVSASAVAIAALSVGMFKAFGPLANIGRWEAVLGLVAVLVLLKALRDQSMALRTLEQDVGLHRSV